MRYIVDILTSVSFYLFIGQVGGGVGWNTSVDRQRKTTPGPISMNK